MGSIKKVVVITPHLNRGGAERVLLNFAVELDRNSNYDVTVLVLGSCGPLFSEFESILNFQFLCKRVSRSLLVYSRFIQKYRDPIILSSHYTTALLIQAARVFRRNGVHIARVPGSPIYERTSSYYGSFRRILFGWALRRSNLLIAQTDLMKHEITTVFRADCNKIQVVSNPIDKIRIKKTHQVSYKRFTIVAAGRLHEVKGFDLLISAIKIVHSKGILIDCYIIGSDKGAKTSLLEQIDELKLSENIKILPETPDLLSFIVSSNGFVLSSRSEGLPNVLLEALHLSIPCISTKCFGEVENLITNNVNGFVCDTNVESLAEAIERLVKTDWRIPPFTQRQESIVDIIGELNV